MNETILLINCLTRKIPPKTSDEMKVQDTASLEAG